MADVEDTRISPSLDPSAMSLVEEYDDDTRPLLGAAETLLSQAHKAIGAIHDCKEAVKGNLTLNDFARLVAVDDQAGKLMTPVFQSWDRVTGVLDANIAKFEAELNQPVEQRATASMASEIRTYFRGLKTGERMVAINQAIRDGDEITVTAVLGGRPYLSGFDAEMSAILLKEWHAHAQPVKAKQLRAMQRAKQILEERSGILKREWRSAVGVHEEYDEDRQGRRVLKRTWTPAEVRERVKASNIPFAVPV
ncbi:hypothetical protein WG908_10225 [Sphingobium sp. AN641]|uniref:hypothetical protein n=1 Tax=Sphingobium sp. AN641 TaxID=3133443 RepID=UPI0030C2578A